MALTVQPFSWTVVWPPGKPPVPVSDSARDHALEALRPPDGMSSNDNDPSRLPTVYPPFRSIHLATDGNVWVLRDLGGDTLGLDVFAESGTYLGQADMTGNLGRLSIALITDEILYAVESDDLGVQTLVLFAIERPSN